MPAVNVRLYGHASFGHPQGSTRPPAGCVKPERDELALSGVIEEREESAEGLRPAYRPEVGSKGDTQLPRA